MNILQTWVCQNTVNFSPSANSAHSPTWHAITLFNYSEDHRLQYGGLNWRAGALTGLPGFIFGRTIGTSYWVLEFIFEKNTGEPRLQYQTRRRKSIDYLLRGIKGLWTMAGFSEGRKPRREFFRTDNHDGSFRGLKLTLSLRWYGFPTLKFWTLVHCSF